MYICICNAIRDTDLREAALDCIGDAESIYARLGRSPRCRQCLDQAAMVINEARADAYAMAL